MSDSTTKTIQHGAVTIIIHRPVLDEKERAKREQQVKDTTATVMRDYLKRKERSDLPV